MLKCRLIRFNPIFNCGFSDSGLLNEYSKVNKAKAHPKERFSSNDKNVRQAKELVIMSGQHYQSAHRYRFFFNLQHTSKEETNMLLNPYDEQLALDYTIYMMMGSFFDKIKAASTWREKNLRL